MCFDEKTEVLSENGWKKWNELSLGENIVTYNQDGCILELKPVTTMYSKKANGSLVRMKNQHFDALVTENHRWPIKTGGTRETRDLKTYESLIRGAKFEATTNKKYDDDFVKLVGWCVTEGCYRKGNAIVITQSITRYPEFCKEIDNLFSDMQ
jgi:ribonucleoside-triphosphate reductase